MFEININKKNEQDTNLDLSSFLKNTKEVRESLGRGNRLSPTTGASYCPRRSYLHTKANKEYNVRSDDLDLYARIGNVVEDWYADLLKNNNDNNAYIAQDIRLFENFLPKYKLHLGGRIDILMEKDEEIFILEIKSYGGGKVKNGKITYTSQQPNETNKPLYKWQLNLYMAYYVLDGYIVARHRDLKDEYIQKYTFDNDSLDALYRAYYARFCIDKDIMPDIFDHIKTSHCSKVHCPFRKKECNFEEKYERVDEAHQFAIESIQHFYQEENLFRRRSDMYNKIQEHRKTNNLHRLEFDEFIKKCSRNDGRLDQLLKLYIDSKA